MHAFSDTGGSSRQPRQSTADSGKILATGNLEYAQLHLPRPDSPQKSQVLDSRLSRNKLTADFAPPSTALEFSATPASLPRKIRGI